MGSLGTRTLGSSDTHIPAPSFTSGVCVSSIKISVKDQNSIGFVNKMFSRMPAKAAVVIMVNENTSKVSNAFIIQLRSTLLQYKVSWKSVLAHLWVRETPTASPPSTNAPPLWVSTGRMRSYCWQVGKKKSKRAKGGKSSHGCAGVRGRRKTWKKM